MTSKEFIEAAKRTDPATAQYFIAATRLLGTIEDQAKWMRILHAAMGLVTEAGEIMDAVKKFTFYGKPLDAVNLIEEAGDIEWYMALLLATLGRTHESIFEINIAKLKARYPEKFSEFEALTRDLAAERKILETGEAKS